MGKPGHNLSSKQHEINPNAENLIKFFKKSTQILDISRVLGQQTVRERTDPSVNEGR
jgi:hypothetical protein